jgi:hypothetical protein
VNCKEEKFEGFCSNYVQEFDHFSLQGIGALLARQRFFAVRYSTMQFLSSICLDVYNVGHSACSTGNWKGLLYLFCNFEFNF